MEPNKALIKDTEAEDVDVHLYKSMIGSLMYLIASRPDITYPKLGLWYPRDSPLDLEAYSDGNYAGARLDRKSTTGGCQFLGKKLISWQCKEQTIVANSTTKAEYVAAASCCGQVLWTQNQMLDYRLMIAKDGRCFMDKFLVKTGVEDRIERAATTTSSLEAEQDSGNINRTQSIKTLNEPLPQGTGSCSGPRTWIFWECYTLFETMMVNAQKEEGEGSGLHTDSHHTPTDTQPSSSNPQKKIKPKRKQRKATEVHSPSSKIPIKESIPTPSNDLLPSGEDSIQLNELIIFYTNLQQHVFDLEEAKTAQAKKIANLKKRVKKLEKRRKSRPVGLRRLRKVSSSKQVESSEKKDSSGAQEDASKQGRSNEVIVDVREKIIEKEVSTFDPVTTGGEVVTAASVEDSAASTTATTANVDDELTLVKTLIAIKAAKPKVISTVANTVTTAITTPRAKGIVYHEQVQAHIPTVSSSKDTGKAKMIEPEKPLKKKDQIALDEEVARKLEGEIKAKIEEEERISREKDKANRAMIEEWDDV
uniref:Putative reverse transcriptase, RNA-dependent DNA polymerase n=1 Tax=Tanacetum cinerariifolium TaxID=118510 RepID=A0A6L2JM93_TANCI|nr:putative reverse transcriptase, RNA-dependent DNA polymerase [Tanacetum cinerariifolium]